MKTRLVVLSGAGISAESGLATFRDSGGLWEGYKVEDVATPQAWEKNPELVLEFYNQRRKSAAEAKPNEAHQLLAELEKHFEVTIITQNVDDLHERAGSSQVHHLHGELSKSRSTINENFIYEIKGTELNIGDVCEKGSQLRPHIVWFGEAVPMMEIAIEEVEKAEIFIVVGTSLVVYPAAGLVNYTKSSIPIYIIDPKIPSVSKKSNIHFIEEKASVGMKKVYDILLIEKT